MAVSRKSFTCLLTIAACSLSAITARGDEPTPPPVDPATEPTEGDASGTIDLDELLGLTDKADEGQQRDAELAKPVDPDERELERKLTAEEARGRLMEAVQQMHESAFRLREVRDTGAVTQRLQEEVLVKLDVLIKRAEQSSSQSSSSSSSSSSSTMQEGQMDQGQQSTQQSQTQQSGQPSNSATGGNPGYAEGPVEQGADPGAAWGALPERIRERLIEGSGDVFSATYRALTEAYYKRIAEEGSK